MEFKKGDKVKPKETAYWYKDYRDLKWEVDKVTGSTVKIYNEELNLSYDVKSDNLELVINTAPQFKEGNKVKLTPSSVFYTEQSKHIVFTVVEIITKLNSDKKQEYFIECVEPKRRHRVYETSIESVASSSIKNNILYIAVRKDSEGNEFYDYNTTAMNPDASAQKVNANESNWHEKNPVVKYIAVELIPAKKYYVWKDSENKNFNPMNIPFHDYDEAVECAKLLARTYAPEIFSVRNDLETVLTRISVEYKLHKV